jgi:excinuclease UvrABC nuclease subunit
MYEVLAKRHYTAAPTHSCGLIWLPKEVLCSFEPHQHKNQKIAVDHMDENISRRKQFITIATVAKRGPKRLADIRALDFANKNANQVAIKMYEDQYLNVSAFRDGTALRELGSLLSLKETPSRIECFVSTEYQNPSIFP